MNTDKHTQEPWQADGQNIIGYPESNIAIARTFGNVGQPYEANARRIVACVNACASMDDPEHGMRETEALLNRTCLARDAAIKQRDELAAVLRAVLEWADPGPQPTHVNNLRDQQKAFAVLDKLQS